MTHVQAVERSRNRVGHQPRLMRQQCQHHRELREPDDQVGDDRADMAALGDVAAPRNDPGHEREQRRRRHRRDDESGPYHGGAQRQHPTRNQRHKRHRRRQRAAQVVDHFPAPDWRDRRSAVARLRGRRVGTVRAAQDPRQQLPVAAGPSMLPRGGDVVARRKLLDQFDVRDQAGARESSFEKIVTQQRVVGNAARQRGLEHVDIVNPFAAV